ncbi:hypothetical protein [Paraburkholderia lacunae]|uniref:hypothetical protein n=1 Tax=Paraburkholderia lacunae TaxID=2211104 RepID=UPI001AD83839|nr:hypothetical protein [Paraburkholderia lacunae]
MITPDACCPETEAEIDILPERLLGFLFVGTPKTPGQTTARPPRSEHVREWRPLQPART